MSPRLCWVACFVGLFAPSLSAGLVVNVDFNSDRGQGEYAGPGAYPGDAGTFWNQSEPQTNPTLANLVASDGTTGTTMGVAITGASGTWGNTVIASALLSDYVYTDNTTANITLSGLTPDGSYALYLYSVADQPGQGAAFTFGDVTSECAGGALLDDFVEGKNYVVMNLVANERGELLGTFTNASSSPRNGGMSGIQIVEVLLSRIASAPVPADTAVDVPRDGIVLGWTPSIYAGQHDVYFGTGFDDVNDADVGSDLYRDRHDANTLPLDRLELGRTYYWRVDEVNATADSTVSKGDIWSFTIEPALYPIQGVVASASIPTSEGAGGPKTTVDGSGLVEGTHSTADPDMWLGVSTPGEPAWIQYDFDRVYKVYGMRIWNYNGLYEMFLGFGVKDITIEYATEPNEWIALGDYQLDRASGKATYAGQAIDVDGIAASAFRITAHSNFGGMQYGLSEVQFLEKPVLAREPVPADGATEVSRAASLSWRPGREAASHQVYLSTDKQAVIDGAAPADTVTESTYRPDALDLGTTYFWRVDEVNEATVPSVLAGEVWDFTTEEYISIDNFES